MISGPLGVSGLRWACCGVASGVQAVLGRGQLRIRGRRLGGRAVGGSGDSRLLWVSQSDEIDAASAQFFVNSSLAPALLFRWRKKSVADALKGIKQHGFSQRRWDALFRYWGAVCRHGPCGPVRSLEHWVHWILPDLHGFLSEYLVWLFS